MVISVHSFTMELNSSVSGDPAVKSIFVECEFLDFDTAELETKSIMKPSEGKKTEFGFRKGERDHCSLVSVNCNEILNRLTTEIKLAVVYRMRNCFGNYFR